MWTWVANIAEILGAAFRERSTLLAENLALPHPGMILKCNLIGLEIRESDQLLWGAASSVRTEIHLVV